jgi:uncharacterized protein
MSKEFVARRLDVKEFAEQGATLDGEDQVREHQRLLAETQGLGGAAPVTWSATGELRNPRHVQPEIWLHLRAHTVLALTCQRCLAPVDVPLAVQRSFRFVADEDTAAAQDDDSEEDVLAISRDFDLVELAEDELLMEMPLTPRHVICPVPLTLVASDEGFEAADARENPFAMLGKLKTGKS